MIQFFNTLTGKLEEFKPLDPAGKEVKMYTCGPTVYDDAHIGNFRTFVFEDLLRRFLEFKKYRVKHVMNITDVDDKTIAGANTDAGARHASPLQRLNEYTAPYIQAFKEDCQKLNILPPLVQPRATEHIEDIKNLIKTLIQKGYAYESGGSVYYRVSKFPNYGKLSKKKLDKNITGARVDVDEYDKEEGADFVLWKKSKEGEPSWDSPWGKGRPGWHIECSVMSMKELGETFDIHAGGEDLIFPHHENEIAQSEAATGKPFVKYWLHSRHLLVNGEKMSKSKGNFYTLRDLLAKGYDPMAIRYALLSVHYRQPMNFTLDSLDEVKQIVEKLKDCYFQCLSFSQQIDAGARWFAKQTDADTYPLQDKLKQSLVDMESFLENDLNISGALSILSLAINEINAALAHFIIGKNNMAAALGFFGQIDNLYGFRISEEKKIPSEVVSILTKYVEVRKAKEFSKSDALRKDIENLGWSVKDGKPGEPSTVRKKRGVWDK